MSSRKPRGVSTIYDGGSLSYINTIINGDSVTALKELPDNSIDMVVTSPPYDNLRAYQDLIDDLKEEYNGYSFPFEQIAAELSRVVKKGGVVVWVDEALHSWCFCRTASPFASCNCLSKIGKIPSKGLLNPESCLYLLSTFIKIGSLLPLNKNWFL